MINSIFTHTSAVRYGGAIYVGGSVDVINSSFNDNSAKSMGASIYSKSTLNVENSTFNSPNVNGTSIIYQLSNNDISLINNTIQSNLLAIYTTNGKFVSPTILTFDNVTVDIGENSTLTATLTDDKGNIIGTDANIESKVGETNVNLAFNETTKKYNAIYNETSVRGQYTITGNYIGATSCNVNNGTLTVEGLHLDEFKVDINSKVYGNFSGNITVLSDNATGNVSIKVNGTKYGQVALVNGVANWLLTNVTPGNYIISFVYSGDDIYESATNSTIVDIDKASIQPADINTNVTDPAYGELTVEVNIPGDVSGNVTLTVDDKNYTVNITDGKAVYQLGKNLTAGGYNFIVTYNGDNNYNPVSKEGNITVTKGNVDPKKVIIIEPFGFAYGNATIEVILPSDVTGNTTLAIDNKTFTVNITDGKAVYQLGKNLNAGKYNFIVTYNGDNNYNSVSKADNVTLKKATINPKAITIEILDSVYGNATIEVTLPSDATGNATLTVDNKNYTVNVTDGKVAFHLGNNLSAGEHNFIVTYNGNNNYNNASKIGNITVTKANIDPKDVIIIEPFGFAYGNTTIEVTLPSDATGNTT